LILLKTWEHIIYQRVAAAPPSKDFGS
jgi:hypothetical protein